MLPFRDQKGAWLDKGTGLKNAHLQGAHLRLPGHGRNGPTLELYSYDNIRKLKKVSPNQRGFGHLAFEVKSVKKTLKKLIKYGGQANGEIVKRKVKLVGEITFVYARDPEGNLIELQNWKKNKKSR
jgi:catechol 2,3-dioxygenase-like lactoylglutathione lyase family enzyme